MHFNSYDLDLERMTLTYESDLKVLKTYLHTKMNFLRQGFRNSSITERHTGTPQTDVTKH